MNNWFESWFDSKYYHLLYKKRDTDDARRLITNLLKALNIHPASKLLDVACGSGRHSILMNEMGFDVTGFDLSKNSITIAKIAEKPGLSFYVHDMRISFAKDKFDAVFNLFTSIGYFTDDKENELSIKNMAESLKKGGMLVIDFLNVHKVKSGLIDKETIKSENIVFNIKRSISNDNFIVKEISVNDKSQRLFFTEKVKALALADFEDILSSNSLKVIHLFGDYDLNKFNPCNSERLIIIAQKI